jgi:hypothetical protein
MNEHEIRLLVRNAIARQAAAPPRASAGTPGASASHLHASHIMFNLPADPRAEGRCVIEPAVMCTHCGYCKSWGH